MSLRELTVNENLISKIWFRQIWPADRRPELDFGMALQARDELRKEGDADPIWLLGAAGPVKIGKPDTMPW